jgi:cellulose synthase/poly-beta-1,6-N-acetylglucosamine synthase-like glycosyltransferase
MVVMEFIFWIGLCIIFYTYVGYALLLNLWRTLFPLKLITGTGSLPDVTMVIPSYNEEEIILKKINNCLSISYPGNIQFLFVNDGSTDRTRSIINDEAGVQLLDLQTRSGKTAALNKAMEIVKTPVVVFSDANTMVGKNSITTMMKHYSHSQVGGVSGEKIIMPGAGRNMVTTAEQIYWQYESFLKKADSAFYSVAGADGGLFSIRTSLFEPIKDDTILDDFMISMNVCMKGYRFIYDPAAECYEGSSASIKEERKRKIRISAGCFQALGRLQQLLNPFRHFRLWLLYVSHRVLRWVICPVLLPLIFFTNLYLAIYEGRTIYKSFFIIQCFLYLMALAGPFIVRRRPGFKLLLVPYYFLFMHFTLYLGFFRYWSGKQTVLWEKTNRGL